MDRVTLKTRKWKDNVSVRVFNTCERFNFKTLGEGLKFMEQCEPNQVIIANNGARFRAEQVARWIRKEVGLL